MNMQNLAIWEWAIKLLKLASIHKKTLCMLPVRHRNTVFQQKISALLSFGHLCHTNNACVTIFTRSWPLTFVDGVSEQRFTPTQLGAAVLASSLSPDEGLTVFAELQKARQCFVLENELHIVYLVSLIGQSQGHNPLRSCFKFNRLKIFR